MFIMYDINTFVKSINLIDERINFVADKGLFDFEISELDY
jgi:hypothetical protein